MPRCRFWLLSSWQIKVVWISQPERIGNAVEHSEEGSDVDGFRDLRIRPARVTQSLHLFSCRLVGIFRQLSNELQQPSFRFCYRCVLQISSLQCHHHVIFGPLQLQEESMRADSVGTLIQR